MFYTRSEFEYVRKSFTSARKGYLHMCHFINNIYKYENTRIDDFDYVRVYDDEAGYLKNVPYDPAEYIHEKGIDFAALFYEKRLKDGKPHSGHIATRHKLFEFLLFYMAKHSIKPKSPELINCLASSDPDDAFHYIRWADSYVMKTSIFRTKEWISWIEAVNEHGGVYKYRWGDNEIYTLFGLMHYEYGVFDLGFVRDGIHHQSKFRRVQDIAPSIKYINQ